MMDGTSTQTISGNPAGTAAWLAPERIDPGRFGLNTRNSRTPAAMCTLLE